MAENGHPYQPGLILHDSIMGALRSTGRSMEDWCRDNGVNRSLARQATFGQSNGPAGKALLDQLIEAAGPDLVRALYLARLHKHIEEVRRTQGRMAAEHGTQLRERRAS